MSDYIKREDVINAIEKYRWPDDMIDTMADNVIGDIEDIPAADVVERKRGYWDDYDKVYFRSCSECGFLFPSALLIMENFDFSFCPNCGADMRGDSDV